MPFSPSPENQEIHGKPEVEKIRILEDFDYHLPQALIAQYPLEKRDAGRLLLLHKKSGKVDHGKFPEIRTYLKEGDLILFNDTRVMPARLIGKKETGGKAEILLCRRIKTDGMEGSEEWQCMAKSAKGIKKGCRISFGNGEMPEAVFLGRDPEGFFRFNFHGKDIMERLKTIGRVPLPPYIRREPVALDSVRYQTVFAKVTGAVAAPTAGLHFTEDILNELKKMGVEIQMLTLHTGPATFLPVRSDILENGLPGEYFRIERGVAQSIIRAKGEKRRVIAVGSTVTRAVETAFRNGFDKPFLEGETGIFIYPGFSFRVIDALVTNFHLPRSTLIMLTAAFAGRENIMRAYKEAVDLRYRFFSYGDCMLIV